MDAELVLELHGVRARIRAQPVEFLSEVDAALPRFWGRPLHTESVPAHTAPVALEIDLSVTGLGDGNYRIAQGGVELMTAPLGPVLDFLGSHLDQQLALNSPEKIFVHAGVVAIESRAALIVGGTFAGKTTLVAALVRSGASYLSDEYAVLDQAGLVHPFPRSMSVRIDGSTSRRTVPAESIGGEAATEPLPVGLALLARYRPGAQWSPRRLCEGEAVLALMQHTAQARERPAECLTALRRTVERATVLEGERGDAEELGPWVRDALRVGPRGNRQLL